MAVNQTWTDPSTSGAIDLSTDDVLTEAIYDKILSNLKHIAGTTGFTATPSAARGIEPASGYFHGAVGVNRHIESGAEAQTVTTGGSGTGYAVTFANAYASAPKVIVGMLHPNTSYNQDARAEANTITTTGFTLGMYQNTGGDLAMSGQWIAEGAD